MSVYGETRHAHPHELYVAAFAVMLALAAAIYVVVHVFTTIGGT